MLPELHAPLDGVREFLRPVLEQDLPDMSDHFATAARVFTALGIATQVLLVALYMTTADVMLPSVALWGVLLSAFWGVSHAASWTARGARHARGVFVASIVMLVMGLAFSPVAGPGGPVVLYSPVAVLAAAAFLPWRPRNTLALTPLVVLAPPLAYRLLGQPFPIADSLYVLVGCATCIAGAAANQIHRKLWARVEAVRRRMVAAERMSSLGRMVASIAHELKTPVAVAQNCGLRIRDLSNEFDRSIGHSEVTDADLHEIAHELQESSAVLRSALDRTRTFLFAVREQTRQSSGRRERFSMRARIDQIAHLLAHRLKQTDVHLDCDAVPPDLSLTGDPRRFDQILTNLISNAIDACGDSPQGGSVRLAAALDEESHRVSLRVEDEGPGVPQAIRERIFEPLFTTRGDAHGTGLGLSIARDIAAADFGGWIVLRDTERGACFEVTLELDATPQQTDPSPWTPATGSRAAE